MSGRCQGYVAQQFLHHAAVALGSLDDNQHGDWREAARGQQAKETTVKANNHDTLETDNSDELTKIIITTILWFFEQYDDCSKNKDKTEKRTLCWKKGYDIYKRLWHYKKEVYVEKSGHEGKNRAEVGIREKNVPGGVQDQGGCRTTVFTVVCSKCWQMTGIIITCNMGSFNPMIYLSIKFQQRFQCCGMWGITVSVNNWLNAGSQKRRARLNCSPADVRRFTKE